MTAAASNPVISTASLTKVDGFTSLISGVHSGLDPSLVAATGFSRGSNVSVRGGLLKTRPCFADEVALPAGAFQGAGRWSLNSGDRVVAVLSGRVYVYVLDTGAIQDLGLLLNDSVAQVHIKQAERFLVIQDSINTPVVLKEAVDGTAELQTGIHITPGSVMEYAHGRLHYVPTRLPLMVDSNADGTPDISPTESGRMGFASGDICDLSDPASIFNMTEHMLLDQGGELGLPQELGFVTAMSAMRNAATGTGVGALVVMARSGVSSFDVSIPRGSVAGTNYGWKNTSNSISQVLFQGAGTMSPRTVLPVNDDLLFVDSDGALRSLRYTKTGTAAAGGALSNVPLSPELAAYVALGDRSMLPLASAAHVDNRYIFTVAGADGVFKALAVLDFARIAGYGNQVEGPSYDGVWTGFDFAQVLTARKGDQDRLLAVVKTDENAYRLLRLDDTATVDYGGEAPVSQVFTRSFDFTAKVDLKNLQYVEAWVEGIEADVPLSVYYRPQGYPLWSLLGTRTLAASPALARVQRKVRFSLDPTTVGANPITGQFLSTATYMQFALEWRGRMTVNQFRAVAVVVAEPPESCELLDPSTDATALELAAARGLPGVYLPEEGITT